MQDEHETRDEANDAAPSQPISKPKAGEADQHDHEKLPPDEALALERALILVACLEMRLMVAERVDAGEPAPHVRLEARRQLGRCTFQQPQLKAEVWLVLGDAERSCGNDAAAREAYEKAAALVADVPDPHWRERAERALVRLR